MQRSAIILLLLLALLAISPFAVLANATIVVNTAIDEDEANSACSLREAIIAANTNTNYRGCVGSGTYGTDTISFSPSVFNVSQTITLISDLPDITSRMTITGPGSNLLEINGDCTFQAFYITNAAVVTISGTSIRQACVDFGSAININSGTVTLNNAFLGTNSANVNGGAIYINAGAKLTVNNSSFNDNDAQRGGAIYSLGDLRVNNSVFFDNVYGSAIYSIGTSSIVGGSLFYENDDGITGLGGAYYGIGTIFNSTFYNNEATNGGGAIAINEEGKSLKLIHVTVVNNTATNDPGDGVYVGAGTFSIMNSIIANNSENDCLNNGGTVSVNYSLIKDASCGITSGLNGNVAADPLFIGSLQNNGGLSQSIMLAPSSPAANAGSNNYRNESNAAVNTDFNGDNDKADVLGTDQRGTGFPRTNHTTVDMGAFESSGVYTGLTVDTTSDSDLLLSCTAAAADCSLRGAIMVANARTGNETISFHSSVFATSQTISLTANLPSITGSLTIDGPSPSLLTISGNDNYRPFTVVNGATVTILDLKIQDGYSGDFGGGIYAPNGNLILTNTVFESNHSSGEGGAVYLGNGNLTIRLGSFSYNSSNSNGGAIRIINGLGRIEDSSFNNHTSGSWGGAISSETPVYIGGSSFNTNNAVFGGGVALNDGAIFNSSFANHSASIEGGAILKFNGSLSLVNVTITNSSAGSAGAGVFSADSNIFIYNSIIANSTLNGDCHANTGTATVYNSLIESGGCGIVNGVDGNIIAEPFLDPDGLQDNGGLTQTIELAPSSPAVNAGSNSYLSEVGVGTDINGDADTADTLSTDQRGTGFPRITVTIPPTNVDMGAFESSGGFTGLVVDTTSDTELFYCTNAANDCSLRSAIALANARPEANTITFDSTVFNVSRTITLNGAFPQILSDLTITGPGQNLLTIDGNYSYRPFYIDNDAVVSISGLRVSHAASGGEHGAAIFLFSGSLSLTNTTFNNNEAAVGRGGVIYIQDADLSIDGSSFTQNVANDLGGVIFSNAGSISISDSSFSQNSSTMNGGSIHIDLGSLTISDSSFSQNHANGSGGAIYNNAASMVLRDSSFSENDADSDGGAIYTNAAIEVIDSLFESNVASSSGGAILSTSIHPNYTTITGSSFGGNQADYGGALVGWLRIVNSSFFENTATSSGGAVYSFDQSVYLSYVSMGFNNSPIGGALYSENGYIELLNSIVADSTNGGDCAIGGSATLFSIASILEDDSCGFNETINGNLVVDPMFDARGLQDNGGSVPSLAVSPLSPAINGGNPGSGNAFLFESAFGVDVNGDGDTDDAIDFDQRGTSFPRFVGANPDMGAIEQTASVLLEVDTTSDANILVCTNAPGDCSLRGAINIANANPDASTISFNATVFATAQTITLTSDLPSITASLTITGPGDLLVTIDGNDNRPFYINNSAFVTLENIMIENGAAAGNGAAINLNSGNLTINGLYFLANQAGAAGGALFVNSDTTAVVNDSFFNGNAATTDGGAIYNNGQLRINNSTIHGNLAVNGAGVYNNNTTNELVVGGSSFMNNLADYGGAIFGRATVFNSSFDLSRANNQGGAFYLNNVAHELTLVNVTVINSTGGSIYLNDGSIEVMNTIVANNTGGDCVLNAGTATISHSLFEDGGCGISDGVDGNLTGVDRDPLLWGAIGDNGGTGWTVALPPASPAHNTGNNAYLSESFHDPDIDFNDDNDFDDSLETDQRGIGFNRSNDGTVDMGAYESNGTFAGLVVDIDTPLVVTFCTSAPGDCTLSGAIFLANNIADNTITFDTTFFSSPQIISLEDDSYNITEDLTITGPGANLLRLNLGNSGSAFTISDAIVSISGMSLLGNDSNFSPLIYLVQGNLSINNMSFSDNVAYSGAAIYANPSTILNVNNSSFTGNSATTGDGGAINGATGSTVIVTNSSFSNNSTVSNGGAIFSDSGVFVMNSSFSGNTANNGGAVYANANATIRLSNSSFYMNTASSTGGAFSVDGNGFLLNVTISANTAPAGGGLFVDGNTTVRNSILANSTGGDCVYNTGSLSIGHSLIEDAGCGITMGLDGNLTGEPYIAPFANYGGSMNMLGLLPFSPAINAGHNAYLDESFFDPDVDFTGDGNFDDSLTTDQRGAGFPRTTVTDPVTSVDMGAFETSPMISETNLAPIRNYYTTNTPTLSWSRVSWATGYELQISNSTGFGTLFCSSTPIAVGASEPSYTTCALAAGTYYWRVRATSATGPGAWSTVDVFVIGGP